MGYHSDLDGDQFLLMARLDYGSMMRMLLSKKKRLLPRLHSIYDHGYI